MPLDIALLCAAFASGGLAGIIVCQIANHHIERRAKADARKRFAAKIKPVCSDLTDSDASLPRP
jgi:hypothetical protein